MATLREIQALVHGVLRRETALDAGALALGVRADRLGIYRGFVAQHVTGILAKLYPTVRALVGEAAWDELALAFFREVPARSWELNACAEPFAAWLDGRVGAGGLHPFLVPLAQVEWEQFAVALAPVEIPDPAGLDRLVLNPTTSALALPYPVVRFLVERGDDVAALSPATPMPDPEDEVALLFRRHGTHHVGYHQAGDDLLFALKVVAEGVPLVAAADLARVPVARGEAALRRAVAIGLLLGPVESALG